MKFDQSLMDFVLSTAGLFRTEAGGCEGYPILYPAEDRVFELYATPPKHWDSLKATTSVVWKTDDLLIDEYAGLVYRSGKIVHLTRTEYALLLCLVRNSSQLLPRKMLLMVIESMHCHPVLDNTLSRHISRLRVSLDGSARRRYVETRSSIGYTWKPSVDKLFISR